MKGLNQLVVLFSCILLVAVGCQSKSLETNSNPISKQEHVANDAASKSVSGSGNNKATLVDKTPQKELEGVDFFIGEWLIWIPGGIAESKSPDFGNGTITITREYVAGVQGNVLTVKKDHTYHWVTPTEVVTGDWEENDDGRIILIQGQHEFDWYVEKTSANEIKFYSFGLEEYGTRIQD